MMPNLEVLGSLVRDIQQNLSQLFYVMLPVAILFSIAIGYLKSGDVNFPEVIKRSFVAAILLASFPEISNLILDICDGIALKIDNLSGLETFIRMAQEKSQNLSVAKNLLLLKYDDLFIAVLSFASFILLYIARYATIALYYFYWILLSICSPLMILCYIFPRTAGVTANLYRGLIEVACWKILWSVMSAMLTSIAFATLYKNEESYLILIVMNLIIAIALLSTPKMMRSLIGEGVQATSQTIGAGAALAMLSVPSRLQSLRATPIEYLTSARKSSAHKLQKL